MAKKTHTHTHIMLNEPNNINFEVKCYVSGEDCYCYLSSKMYAPTEFTNDTLHYLKRLHFTPDVTLKCSKHLPTIRSTMFRFR